MSVKITLELRLKPEVVDEFYKNLPATLDETRAFGGCIQIGAYSHSEDVGRVIVLEEWESAEAYQAYLAWRTETGFMDALGGLIAAPPAINTWPNRIA